MRSHAPTIAAMIPGAPPSCPPSMGRRLIGDSKSESHLLLAGVKGLEI